MTITVSDETFVGDIINRITLEFEGERVTVAQIISERVRQEVANYNARLPEFFHALVAPARAEKTSQGFTFRSRKRVDAETQVGFALKAFCANGFFVLIDNRQAESLQQEILLNEETVVTFIKLTPLVGG
jgi:hypothetical protein